MKPSASMTSLRETVKTKIFRHDKENDSRNRESRNRENESRNRESESRNRENTKKYSSSNFDCTATRKPSLMKMSSFMKSGRSTKALSLRDTNRNSLVSMLLTRLTK